jgi:hypothetical protein
VTTTSRRDITADNVNDIESILAVVNTDASEVIHAVESANDTIFTWDYEQCRTPLVKLYEKAKTSQWNVTTDLDWSTDVDPERVSIETMTQNAGNPIQEYFRSSPDSPLRNWTNEQFVTLGVEAQNWRLSQFLHGEQGALVCTAKIVETVPWIDAKYYAATQVMDEARHVEVFAKYLDTKLTGHYPINAHLRMLLDDIIADSRWDMTYLGMQIMVEGLALAAFGFLHMLTTEPLLKKILRYVMSDEARHVAFGVLSLREAYEGMTAAELRERQEFVYEASVRMRDRFLQQEVWERLGVDVRAIVRMALAIPPEQNAFQAMLFSKIVPNVKKLGLLDANAGWLRKKFTELGVIQFEDWVDTGEEYSALDEVAKDRAAV